MFSGLNNSVIERIEQLKRVVSTLLDATKPIHSLRPEVVELTAILFDSQTVRPASYLDISEGETRTSNGLAISPAMAAMCADDYMRTIAFIRGAHAAILDVRKQFSDRPARVLYAGCGPYAILAVPLMTIFAASEVSFTLLDIHSESVISVHAIADTLGLSDSIFSIETVDARSYNVCPDQLPDVILIEVMQACLEKEPQVAITRHLLAQAPNAILIPQQVQIELMLVDPSREFPSNGGGAQQDRVYVGVVFVLNREKVNLWRHNVSSCLPGLSVQIPDTVKQSYQPMLFTKVQTYRQHILKDYDSGLTCPSTLPLDEAIRAGDTIQFYYELGRHPRLTGKTCVQEN